jgi:peptidoglycan/xylan/chitin deacetylase (PgdA/CDA1 family)
MDQITEWFKVQARTGRSLIRWGMLPIDVLRRTRLPGVVILLYHRIGGGTWSEIDLTAGAFERQMRYLRQHCRFVSLDEVVELSARGSTADSSSDSVAVTFDDGCAETYEVAYPILCQYRIPATVYVPASYIEEGRPFDFGAYRRMDSMRRPRPLTWAQAAEMVRSNLVAIGGHTNTHADLSGGTVAEVQRELDDCDRLIEARLGQRPRHFAYPWGNWSDGAHAVVAGRYETVTLGGPAKNPYAGLDLSRLWRFPVVQTDGFWLFRARLHSLPARTAVLANRPVATAPDPEAVSRSRPVT